MTQNTSTTSSSLWIPPALRARIEFAAKRSHPRRSCGVLVGEATRELVTVLRVVDSENLALRRDSKLWELDPLALFRAERKAQGLGLAVVGIWIAREGEEARPTRTDLALAWEGWSYLFVATAPDEVRELRSWRLVGGEFEEEALVAG
jgi:proteasome lid subunit RPN8/RPN11